MSVRTYTIFEVLTLGGPVVAHHPATGRIITINKKCFAAWTESAHGFFICENDCFVSDVEKVGDCTDFSLVVQAGHDWLRELLATEGDNEPSNA